MATYESIAQYLESQGGGPGTDTTAVHTDTAAEITSITSKSPLVGADTIIIEDSADSNNKKSSTVADIRITESQITDLTHTDADAIHDNVAAEISAITAKATPTTSDYLLIEDAADSDNKKRITIGDLPISAPVVEAKTSNYTVVSADRYKTFTNEGASASIQFDLPTAASGEGPFTFIVQDSDLLTIVAASGDTIRIGSEVTSTNRTMTPNGIGDMLTIQAINATEWMATAFIGTWTGS